MISRRELLRAGAALTVLQFLELPLSAIGLPKDEGTPLRFLDVQPDGKMLKWENLDSWITPNEQVFAVSHYGQPKVEAENYSLELSGLLRKPRTFSLDELKKRKRKDVIATLECSGNSSNPGFAGAI